MVERGEAQRSVGLAQADDRGVAERRAQRVRGALVHRARVDRRELDQLLEAGERVGDRASSLDGAASRSGIAGTRSIAARCAWKRSSAASLISYPAPTFTATSSPLRTHRYAVW